MQTIMRNSMKLAVMLLLAAILLGSAGIASAASLPTSPCVSVPGATTCDLYAMTGTSTLFGTTNVTIWGYSATGATGSATLPGPVLTVNQGDTVTVNLHNNLSEPTALNFQGQAMVPDLTGVAAGGTKVYTFIATNPGTFLYEAGLIPGKQHQVAMGLYGALVVKPSDGTAYGTSATAFNEETLLVLSEFDPVLAVNPASFEMRNYAPRYFLINGKAYASPFAGAIPVSAGNTVLLRYVNAGLQSHAMSTLGTAQKAIAVDGHALAHPHSMVGETIATGQTLDALVTIPAAAPDGTRFAVYDANMMLRNSTASGFGGMLTFLTASATTPPTGDTTGPAVSSGSLSPNPTNGSVDVSVSATVSDASTGNHNVIQAEFYIDSTGGSPTAMTGAFGSPTVIVSGNIPAATLAGLVSGTHTIYIRGRDDSPDTVGGNWGPFLPLTLNLDKTGPVTSGLALSPNPSSGAESVALSATGNDTATGNSNVTAAEYWVDSGAHTAMTLLGTASPSSNFTATIPAGLSMGTHVVSVRSQDSFGNWGAAATINLQVGDTAAPTTSGVSASPNPNNGTLPFNTSVPAVRVTASFSDVATGNSNLAAAEGFIDTVSATGTGFVFIATDGTFNSPAETGYSDIPLAVVGALTQGNHTIYVHAKDAAGNWGAMSTTTLVIDKLPPTVSGVTLTPPASNNTAVVVSANATDVATGNSNIAGGEYFIDTAGAAGTGAAMTPAAAAPNTTINATIPLATIAALTAGNHTVYVRARDVAGNWGTTASGILLIDRTPPTFTSITLTPNSIPQGTASVNLTVNGASDGAGGSGVVGGEYWFGTTNPAPGSGTAFTGLTTSIPTGSLTAGTYTVRARIRDAAGNWYTATGGFRSATLTVTGPPPDAIFSDGFESGNFSGWPSISTGNTTRLNVTNVAALVGSWGMQAQGNNTNYVQYFFGTAANPVTSTFDARFYFNPNGNASTVQDIFAASSGTSPAAFASGLLFHVRYRINAGQPQVQIQVGSTANATWVNITNASHRIEMVWQSGTTLQLYVDGALSQTLTAGTGSVASFRLGSVTSGGSATIEYFDAFAAKRSVSPLIGP